MAEGGAQVDDVPAEVVDADEQQRLAREAELEAGRMPFMEHLGELRVRMRNAALGLAVGFGIAFYFSKQIARLLEEPLVGVWRELAVTYPALGEPRFNYQSLTEPFWAYLSISLWAGMFIASPIVFHQLWLFVAPGLYRHERRFGLIFAVSSAVLFVGGALFCYTFVLPAAFEFFLEYSTKGLDASSKQLALSPLLSIEIYLDFAKTLLLAFGLVFELPLVISFMGFVGLVTHGKLWKFNRYFVVIAFIAAAILTPGPDMYSQVAMALPLIALYNLAIGIVWLINRRRAGRAPAPPPKATA